MKAKEKKKSIGKTVGCLVILIILALLVRVIFWGAAQYRNSVWDGKTNLGIAIKGKDYLLVYINRLQARLYVIKIPANTLIQDSEGNGYTLDNLWRLAKIANKKNPDLRRLMQKLFAVPVQAQYENEAMDFNHFDIKLRDVLNGKTNLTIFDYFNLKNFGGDFELINLEKEVLHQLKSIREEEQLFFDPQAIDSRFGDIFNDLSRARLRYNFQIVKNTEANEDAKFYERMINNIGWKVSDIENSPEQNGEKKNQCILQEKSTEENFIKDVFFCELRIDPTIHYSIRLLLFAKEN